MVEKLTVNLTIADDEQATTECLHEAWKEIGYGRAPDVVRTYPDGSEKWYYLTYVAGMDDDGPYELVTDGPASGEKVYARW